jgi:phosphate transport system permease protein
MPEREARPPVQVPPPPAAPPRATEPSASRPQRHRWREFIRQGVPAVWFTGMMACWIVLLLAGMVTLILTQGLGHFWPATLVELRTESSAYLGPIRDREQSPLDPTAPAAEPVHRLLLKIGNRDVHGLDFRWFEQQEIVAQSVPPAALVVERREYGDLHGYLQRVLDGESVIAEGPAAWDALQREARAADKDRRSLHDLEARFESKRRPISQLEHLLEGGKQSAVPGSDSRDQLEQRLAAERVRLESELAELEASRSALEEELAARSAVFTTADGRERSVRLDAIVRAYRPNAMNVAQKLGHYGAKVREFLFTQPRESNTEGGIWPALFGTVMMVLLMTVAVVPLGVIAALYLHEYAKQGPVLRAVRLAVNNLAGVPSIVFGMFGLAFFVYGVGGSIDRALFADALPNPTFGTGGILWASLTLALLTLPVVIVATEEGLSAVPRANREASLALGATQWQTLWNVVLPNALPGILTGLILAVSRGAGEVAPLMITGVVKLAPSLPLDANFPFLHLERKFMHLGFHIYDVSMQSPNVEAAKPMVYTTTLLLLLLVVALNTTAIVVRNRMRRRYRGAAL